MPVQRVRVLWNGASIGALEFRPDKGWDFEDFTLPVPAAAQRMGKNTVTFASRFAVSPKDLEPDDPAADARRISFGIRILELLERCGKPHPFEAKK